MIALKQMLSFLGLLSDFLGAFALAVPLVWNTVEFVNTILRATSKAKDWFYIPVRRDFYDASPVLEMMHMRLIVAGCEFAVAFLIIAARLVQVSMRGPLFWASGGGYFLDGLAFTAGFFVCSGILWVVLTYLVSWIARGHRDQKLGIVGLTLLSLGFVLQTFVTFFL